MSGVKFNDLARCRSAQAAALPPAGNCTKMPRVKTPTEVPARGPQEKPARPGLLAAAQALCLIGFPALPMLVYLSARHPALPGPTAADQIAQLAAAAGRWAEVHLALSAGGFFGLGAVLVYRSRLAGRAPALWANAAAAIGVVGAVIFTGTVLMEVTVIPELATSCARTPACLAAENAPFTQALADQGWRVLPGLSLGGRTMMSGLALLAVLAVVYGGLRAWEALAVFFGSVLEIVADTGLHAWGNFQPARGMPGLAAVALLAAGAGVSHRLFTEPAPRGGVPSPAEAGPEPAGD